MSVLDGGVRREWDRRGDVGLLLLLVACLTSLALLPGKGTEDVFAWQRWMDQVLTLGLRAGYVAARGDYPPGCVAILLPVAWLARAFDLPPLLALKLSLLLALWATSLVAWLWTRQPSQAAALHIALALNAAALGYLDVFFGLPLLLAFLAYRRGRLALAGFAFGAASLVKWQPLIVAPCFALHLLAGDGRWRERLGRAALFGLPVVGLLAGARVAFGPEMSEAFDRAASHGYLSGDALNLSWLSQIAVRAWAPDWFGGLPGRDAVLSREALLISTHEPAIVLPLRLLFALSYVAVLLLLARSRRGFPALVAASLFASLAYFAFNTGVHENHLFLVVVLAAILAWEEPARRRLYLIWALAASFNLWLFYGLGGTPWTLVDRYGLEVSGIAAAACLTLVLFTLADLADVLSGEPSAAPAGMLWPASERDQGRSHDDGRASDPEPEP
jgi:hypothetical protein